VFSDQILKIEVAHENIINRCQYITSLINTAMGNYEELSARRTVFDTHGGPGHLVPWLNVINEISHSNY
jgi:hypothetical protein